MFLQFFVHCITHNMNTKYLLSPCISSFLYFMLIYLHTGYQKFVDPGISPEFQAAAMRLGITMAPPGVYMRYCPFFPPLHILKNQSLYKTQLVLFVYFIRNIMICIVSPTSYRNRTCHFREVINIDGSSSPALRLCNSFWKRQVHNVCAAAFS